MRFTEMTVDELWMKVDAKFVGLDEKLDDVRTTVRLHDQTLAQTKAEINAVEKKFDKEIEELRKSGSDSKKDVEGRISKLEKWMWFTLGAGGAAGAGIAKLIGG